jgi:antitoxin (DNA-binding transcriptional repressor) of toxin-antitoxin stability system
MYIMKRYGMSQARARMAEVLDSVENGQNVLIERRGVRFRVSVVQAPKAKKPPEPVLEILDPAIERGTWSWEAGATGSMTFKARRR